MTAAGNDDTKDEFKIGLQLGKLAAALEISNERSSRIEIQNAMLIGQNSDTRYELQKMATDIVNHRSETNARFDALERRESHSRPQTHSSSDLRESMRVTAAVAQEAFAGINEVKQQNSAQTEMMAETAPAIRTSSKNNKITAALLALGAVATLVKAAIDAFVAHAH